LGVIARPRGGRPRSGFGRAPAVVGDNPGQRAVGPASAAAEPRVRGADARLENPEGSCFLHEQKPARLLSARANPRDSTRAWRVGSGGERDHLSSRANSKKQASGRIEKARAE